MPIQIDNIPVVYVGDLPQSVRDNILSRKTVAVDIETAGTPEDQSAALDFARGTIKTITFYAPGGELALVRVTPDAIPLNITEILENDQTRKILHHAMFDLRFCIKAWNCVPRFVRCTKVAAKLLGVEHKAQSLQPLLQHYLNVAIPKGYAVSDWGAATLSDEQLRYAADDVLYLPDLYEQLTNDLFTEALIAQYYRACDWLPTCADLEVRGFKPSALFEY